MYICKKNNNNNNKKTNKLPAVAVTLPKKNTS